MGKYLLLRQNDVDPSPEARRQVGSVLEFCFKFAEYYSVAGLFWFLAQITQNWAVITIALILWFLLVVHLFSIVSGFIWFNWRGQSNRILRATLLLADSAVFFAIYFTLWKATWAVYEAMSKGLGP